MSAEASGGRICLKESTRASRQSDAPPNGLVEQNDEQQQQREKGEEEIKRHPASSFLSYRHDKQEH
jgi:hypothetical protein